MQAHGGRVERNRAVGDNPRVVPALSLVIVHQEHMVGEYFAEAELAFVRRLFLRCLGQFHFDFLHRDSLSRLNWYYFTIGMLLLQY